MSEVPLYATQSTFPAENTPDTQKHPSLTRTILYGNRTLETTQGQIDGFFSQLPFNCFPPEEATVGD